MVPLCNNCFFTLKITSVLRPPNGFIGDKKNLLKPRAEKPILNLQVLETV